MQIFLAPRSNETSYKNFLSTIENGVDFSSVEKYLDEEGKNKLKNEKKLFAWGNKDSKKTSWAKMKEGDLILFYKRGSFVHAGKLLYKQQSKDLGLSLWPPKKGEEPWTCVFFLKNLTAIDLSIIDFNNLSQGKYHLGTIQGFMPVKNEVVESILNKFGNLDNFIENYKARDPEVKDRKIDIDIKKEATNKPSRRNWNTIEHNDQSQKEANILDFRLVQSAVDRYKKDRGIIESNETVDHDIFLELSATLFLGFSEDEVADGLVSGKKDAGIDAVYIDNNTSDDRPEVFIIQAKYYRNEDKYDRNLPEETLTKMQVAIADLLLSGKLPSRGLNEMLVDKLKDVRALTNPKINIIFISNSAQPSADAKEKFRTFINSKQGSGGYFSVRYLTLIEIAEALRPKTRKQINTKLRLTGKYFDWTIGGVKVVVGRISGKELAKLRESEGDLLFDKNVRGYLKLNNQINKQIFKTASDISSASNFFFLNNGITIVCGRVNFFAVDESPDLEINDLQIVNGGQTTNAIFEAYRNKTLSDNVYCLIRIVETLDQGLLDMITGATNTQTSVKSRDLRSNDDIQRTLEQILKTKGYYYESRANKYKDNSSAKGKRIDMVVAAQALYAFGHKMPADAKNKKRDLTGGLYFEIFNETTSPDDLLLAYKTLEYVRKMHQEFNKKYGFVKYAEFHSVTMLGEIGVKSLSDLKDESIKKKYKKILEATKRVVDEESKNKGDDYSHRALFINPTTIGRIKEEYLDKI